MGKTMENRKKYDRKRRRKTVEDLGERLEEEHAERRRQ
jgi:hypothetical protein